MAMPSLWRVKLMWGVALTVWISLPYHLLQHYPLLPAWTMTPTVFDDAIPFAQWMAWPYLSLFVMLPIAPFFIQEPRDVRRFAIDFALIGLVSHVAFLVLPTQIERPSVDASDPLYQFVLSTDGPRNACPSLHASMTVYSALWCGFLIRHHRYAWLTWIGVTLWTLAIFYATIATRQHVLVDLLAGAVLALLVFFRPERIHPDAMGAGLRERPVDAP